MRLRQHGIGVLTRKELLQDLQDTRGAFLYLNVHSQYSEQLDAVVYYTQLDCRQVVLMLGGQRTTAPTWETGAYVGFLIRENFKEDIRDLFRDMVDEFINDYLAANPPEDKDEDDHGDAREGR